MLHALSTVLREEGFCALYKGWLPSVIVVISSGTIISMYAFPIKCTEVILGDDKETVLEICTEYDHLKKTKPMVLMLTLIDKFERSLQSLELSAFIMFCSAGGATLVYYYIQNPVELDDWLGDLNPESKVVISEAYDVPSLRDAMVGDIFRFERLVSIGKEPP
ncbi:unnamed protein product [Fraxinus pennsylvanica]|uniref:Uncharacterized protein n=1 Tax=Fraxinus pennsylvanica TaxID=56036 RepID=A0AAD1YLY1_9LAMI|nr:unnamed protein product [Fraxinus pennsylvanica]